MLETHERNSKRKLLATVVSIVVIAGIVVLADHLKGSKTSANIVTQSNSSNTAEADNTPSSTNNSSTSSVSSGSTSTSTASTYKDGSYSASSDYYVPHGNESIKVNLTLSGGVVASVSIENSEGDRDSAVFQEEFASVYKSYVVGKKISGLQLSTISGASDTTDGFNEALSQITSQAQA